MEVGGLLEGGFTSEKYRGTLETRSVYTRKKNK